MNPNKRFIKRRRLLLLFWSSVLLSSVLILGNTFSASTTYVATETSETIQEREYVGPDTCMVCHKEKYDTWSETGHMNSTWSSSRGSTRDPTLVCYTCHTNGTNFETGKFIGEDLYGFTTTNNPVYEGVSCETCHGPYDGGQGEGHMYVTLSAELCGECHSPYHSSHGHAEERWSLSGHSHAHTTLMNTGTEVPRCIHCHSAEGALPWPLGGVNTFAEMENGISCPVCHDPHSEHLLREETVSDLCITCHSHETADMPHMQRQVYNWDTEEYEFVDCATCHMYGWEFATHSEEWEPIVNHTMSATIESCGNVNRETNETAGCHADPDAAWAAKDDLVAMFEEKFVEGEAAVEAAHEAFAEANVTTDADPAKLAEAEAKLNELDDLWHEVELSETLAFHASWHLEEMLDETIATSQEVVQLSEDAMEPSKTVTVTVSETGIQLLAVLGLGIVLLLAAIRRRRVA